MDLSELVFVTKGLLAVSGVILLVVHMHAAQFNNSAQRGRYMLLLGYGVYGATTSTEQVWTGEALQARHWFALCLALGLVCVAVYSIRSEE